MEVRSASCSSVGPGEALHAVKKSILNATDETTDDSKLAECTLPIGNVSLRSKASEKEYDDNDDEDDDEDDDGKVSSNVKLYW